MTESLGWMLQIAARDKSLKFQAKVWTEQPGETISKGTGPFTCCTVLGITLGLQASRLLKWSYPKVKHWMQMRKQDTPKTNKKKVYPVGTCLRHGHYCKTQTRYNATQITCMRVSSAPCGEETESLSFCSLLSPIRNEEIYLHGQSFALLSDLKT